MNSTEGYRAKRETRTQVAETIGMKPDTYRKVKNVHDTANDAATPEPVRAVAQHHPRRTSALAGRVRADARQRAGHRAPD